MPLLDVVNDVCEVVGVEQMASVFSNLPAQRTQQEMLAVANEMAQRIAYDTRDWQMLTDVVVFYGDGVKTSFPLPSNYKRMLVNSSVWRSTNAQIPLRFINSFDEWLRRQAINYWDMRGQWILQKGNMLIQPPLPAGQSVTFGIIAKGIIKLSTGLGGLGEKFLADTDSFVLDERVLKLGMIAEWKQHKGSPYAEDMATYQDAISNIMGRDQPGPIIIGSVPMSQAISATVAYPWPVPT